MKKNLSFVIILLIQLLVFYLVPLIGLLIDPIGMVLLIIILTFILALVIGSLKTKLKYLYPIIISILFIPSVYIYYNESALIHAIWYLIVSSIAIIISIFLDFFFTKK